MSEIYEAKNHHELENKIGYVFKDDGLLVHALTHSSYCNENRLGAQGSNERLEFLGDSVLSVVTSEYLFENYPTYNEGELSKIRAAVVCENTLAGFATEIGLGDYILMGHGEASTNGRHRKSVTSDAFEAVIAAIFLDGGLEEAKKFVLSRVKDAIKETVKKGTGDYKSRLQSLAQETPEEILEYVVVAEEGPPHDKLFTVEARLNSNVLGIGQGRKKVEAEQMAAKEALKLFGENEEA